jgi:hypothetical protein
MSFGFAKNTEKQSAAETAPEYMGKQFTFYVFMKLYLFYLCSGEAGGSVLTGEVKNALF